MRLRHARLQVKELLFREGLVWAGSDRHEVWKRDPLPIAVHDLSVTLRAQVLGAISAQQREYTVVYNSPNVLGQLVAVECGMAVAVLTRSNLPTSLKILDTRAGLPELPELEVVLMRSPRSKRLRAVDALHEHIVRSLAPQAELQALRRSSVLIEKFVELSAMLRI